MNLKPGTRLQSTTCDTQVIVVKATDADVDLRCGGGPMVGVGDEVERTMPSAAHSAGSLLGKRYVADDFGLEVLCSKAGAGSLSVGDDALQMKSPKALPASD